MFVRALIFFSIVLGSMALSSQRLSAEEAAAERFCAHHRKKCFEYRFGDDQPCVYDTQDNSRECRRCMYHCRGVMFWCDAYYEETYATDSCEDAGEPRN